MTYVIGLPRFRHPCGWPIRTRQLVRHHSTLIELCVLPVRCILDLVTFSKTKRYAPDGLLPLWLLRLIKPRFSGSRQYSVT